ncbi:conserved hypothetical protein [uncultured Desulfobacterium sp.]|uniref:Phage protein n=1 Tax=uncultured Desulfobacterium sp. TaxID=201089 RepID=A0A445N2I8_9BACT|nr:conserved hypothetical protein [uncultured Desulfobacterium sp.]
MTRDEILALAAGRSLNVCVSEEIMGNKVVCDAIFGDTEIHTTMKGETVYDRLTPYSENLTAAQLVITRMANLGFIEAKLWENENRPDVICRAALLTLFKKNPDTKSKQNKPKLWIVK